MLKILLAKYEVPILLQSYMYTGKESNNPPLSDSNVTERATSRCKWIQVVYWHVLIKRRPIVDSGVSVSREKPQETVGHRGRFVAVTRIHLASLSAWDILAISSRRSDEATMETNGEDVGRRLAIWRYSPDGEARDARG